VTVGATADTNNELCHTLLNSQSKRAACRSTERYIPTYPHGRSCWSRGQSRRYAATRLLGLCIRIPPEAWVSGSCESCVLCKYRSLLRSDPSSRGVLTSVYASLCVIRFNNNTLHLQWVGRKRSKKERN